MYVGMYVCMYVCMYVRTYVRTYVCTYSNLSHRILQINSMTGILSDKLFCGLMLKTDYLHSPNRFKPIIN